MDEAQELEKLYALFQKDLDKVSRELEEARGILGIRWPNDKGLVSEIAEFQRVRMADKYEMRFMRGLLYTSVFLHIVEVVLIATLLVRM